ERARRLQEQERFSGHLMAELCGVRAIVAPDAHDLARRDRNEQRALAEIDALVRLASTRPRRSRPAQGRCVVDQPRPRGTITHLEPCDSHRPGSTTRNYCCAMTIRASSSKRITPLSPAHPQHALQRSSRRDTRVRRTAMGAVSPAKMKLAAWRNEPSGIG